MMNLTSVILLLAIIFNAFIGLSILLKNIKNFINIFYFFLASATSLWIFTNYIVGFVDTFFWAWFWSSISYASGVVMAFSLFVFCYLFPKKTFSLSLILKIILLFLFLIGIIISFIPDITIKDITINPWRIITGPGVYIIFAYVFILPIISFIISTKKIRSNLLSYNQKIQLKFLISGIFISCLFAVLFNIYLPLLHNNYNFIKIGPALSFVMVALIAYAILKHHLFNIKVIATELLIFALWIIILIRTLISESTTDYVVNGILLISTITLGIFLIRSVIKEVSQREKIEKLAQELSQANEQLRDNNEKLKELDRMKTEFVSMASHQLRTPLTAIKGYSSMLLEDFFGEIKGKVREAVDIVYQSSERLVVIIDDFLSITKIELGKMDFQISSFDLKDLVKVIVKESKVTADKKNLALELEILPGDYTFSGDHGKISQVISNILDNAMKYTEKGGIFAKLEEKDKDKIRITVKDTGIGMTKEDISQLFEKFVRVGQDGRPKYTGTGIGLFLVRQLVEAHQGQVWAESEGLDKGSTFAVELPKDRKGE